MEPMLESLSAVINLVIYRLHLSLKEGLTDTDRRAVIFKTAKL